MKTALFKVRRTAVVLALLTLTLLIFLGVRWQGSAQDDTINSDDLIHAQTDQPAGAGHRRTGILQAVEIPLSTQYQLKGIIAAASVEDSVVIIHDLSAHDLSAHDLSSERRDQHLHLGEQLADGSVLREVYDSSVIIDRDGRLERIMLKTNPNKDQEKTKERQAQEAQPEISSVISNDANIQQVLPRAGLSLQITQTEKRNKTSEPMRRDSLREQQIADSAKLPGYHLEQRSRHIVPPAPDTSVLETPERIVPKAQGNRLPTASYIPPQS